MEMTLKRETKDQAAINGSLLVDGKYECAAMERTTVAIPPGKYSVEITFSPHFGKPMPLLDGVPQRTDIRIHPANWPSQLEGCIAVGLSHDGDDLDNSAAAFNPLFAKILAAITRQESVTIEVVDVPCSVGTIPAPSPVAIHPTPTPVDPLDNGNKTTSFVGQQGQAGFLNPLIQLVASFFHM